MTAQELFDAFAFPESCALGKRVFKKLFLENGELSAADRRALSDAVDGITWQFTLKPSTIPVQAFRDDEREYEEIAVVEVELSDRKVASRLVEIVHRTIPYPVLLVLSDDSGVLLSAAAKRMGRAERNRVVVDDYEATSWFDGRERTTVEMAFIESLRVEGLPHAHFLSMYEGWVQRIVALDCSAFTGTFEVSRSKPLEERRTQLSACRAMDRQIRSLRAAVKGEARFSRQVELNAEIKKLENDLQQHVVNL